MVKIKIKKLIWDDWNLEHIKKHKVKPEEVRKALKSKTIIFKTYQKRFLVLGKIKNRLLAIVLAPKKKGRYYLVTARDMSQKERRYYEKQKNT